MILMSFERRDVIATLLKCVFIVIFEENWQVLDQDLEVLVCLEVLLAAAAVVAVGRAVS